MGDRDKQLKVLDIGTGSGCIALALKKAAPNWSVTGLDISEDALKVAKENAGRNNAEVHWLQADILSPHCPVASSPHHLHFDIIVSNPPYICNCEKKDMDARVLDYEPHSALFVPDTDPLLFYRQIASLATSPAMLFFEINEAYGNEVCEMMAKMGYTDIQLKNDMYGKPRMVYGSITR
jgi:release factor glutamine methyltransferase